MTREEREETRRDRAKGLGRKRERLGMLLADVAEAVGVDRSTIWRWETGRSVPSVRDLAIWSAVLSAYAGEEP